MIIKNNMNNANFCGDRIALVSRRFATLGFNLLLLFKIAACTPIAASLSDFDQDFKSGKIRLTCNGLPCHGSYAWSSSSERTMYANSQWLDLAKEVSIFGLSSDIHYYYLGVAASELGYRSAARKYFSLSTNAKIRCATKAIEFCNGINLPQDITSWSTLLDRRDYEDAMAHAKAVQGGGVSPAANQTPQMGGEKNDGAIINPVQHPLMPATKTEPVINADSRSGGKKMLPVAGNPAVKVE
jgi:hypothetical protein